MLSPRETVRNLPSYHPPLAGRDGLRLDFNENVAGCSARVLARLQSLTATDLARYPEREPAEAAVANFLGVSPSELLLTNGVDEAIHLLCQAYIDAGDEALIVVPTYSMYRIYMLAAGAQLVTVPAGPDFEFPAEAVFSSIAERTRLIAVANPNNPTGTIASPQALLAIAHAAPHAAVLIDEAYYEFHGESLLPQRDNAPNLFIARTFSKAYGLAGLRTGALIGHAFQMPTLRRISSPYNVNAAALACLPAALADQTYIEQYVAEVRDSRTRLQDFLRANEIPFWPSHANFVLVRVGATAADSAAFVEQMRQHGILVRDRSADHGCEACVRITVGARQHADRLLAVLPQVMATRTLLAPSTGARQ